jgi:hypothetical protein
MPEPRTTLEDRRATLEPLIVRAWSDAGFRARLAQRPREAFEEATGLRVPADVELKVHLATAQHLDLEVLDAAEPGFPWERVGPGWTLPEQPLDEPSSFRGGYRYGCKFGDQVVRRGWSDRGWLEQLAQDPHRALAEALGIHIHPQQTFALVVDGPKVRHVVVPFRHDAVGQDEELSELELELVAGGSCVGPQPSPIDVTKFQ